MDREEDVMLEILRRIEAGQIEMDEMSDKIINLDKILSKAIFMRSCDFLVGPLQLFWNREAKKLFVYETADAKENAKPLIESQSWVRKIISTKWIEVLENVKECL